MFLCAPLILYDCHSFFFQSIIFFFKYKVKAPSVNYTCLCWFQFVTWKMTVVICIMLSECICIVHVEGEYKIKMSFFYTLLWKRNVVSNEHFPWMRYEKKNKEIRSTMYPYLSDFVFYRHAGESHWTFNVLISVLNNILLNMI